MVESAPTEVRALQAEMLRHKARFAAVRDDSASADELVTPPQSLLDGERSLLCVRGVCV